ncbi:MAG: preprotein translocase subunit SecA [Bacteroidetes bacterium]|nr:MAG: preprotein translocase subunit SecA [Bacteroidota bacterium]
MDFGKIIGKFLGNKADRDMREISPYVDMVKVAYEEVCKLDHDALRSRSESLKQKVADYVSGENDRLETLKSRADDPDVDVSEKEGLYKEIDSLGELIDEKYEEVLNEILPEAFAIVKDTARRFKENEEIEVSARDYDRTLAASRESVLIKGDKAVWKNSWMAGGNEITWDMVHYDVQLIGGAALHSGKIAEMATGEGKTLVATLPVFLNALTGKGVHVVTVNDYLAKRDSEWMGPIYEFHGLSVDCIDKHQPNSEARRKAYACDITFGTNNEFGFDYLRDNMAHNPAELVQRKHNYAIVDEVDSVLVDDARTPLIISGPVPRGENHEFGEYKPKVEKLVQAQRQFVQHAFTEARKFLEEGNAEKAGFKLLQVHKGLPKYKPLIKLLSEEGNKALLLKTENFYMQEQSKNMHKVTDDLFFIIEEKLHSVELTEKGIDLITGSSDDPQFFILPDIGSEIAEIERSDMTDKKKLELKDKMLQDYAVKSERIHTVNQLLKAYAMFEKEVEYVVIENKVKIVDEQTGRIMEGRRYSDGLHQAIEAKENVKVEAATQTWATITLQNYFRMYHKLAGMTGTAETEAGEFWDIYKLDVMVIPTNRPIARDDREDLIYKTKREKYNAVIDELVKLNKEGRPSLVGTTTVEVSELLSKMLKIRKIPHNVLNAKLHQREAEVVAQAGKPGTVTIATNMAGRGTDIKLTDGVKEAGGLAIIGTERHDSRRVDRQLRGRAGRQGDPGSSQFYVSLEDDLMRLFSSDRIAGMMDRLGLKEGEVIQHSMITKSIERAQKKVEENNFGIRKNLLEYDDVMNAQREVIYKRRKHALFGERIGLDIANMFYDVTESIVNNFHQSGDYEGFKLELIRVMSVESPVDEAEFKSIDSTELVDKIYELMLDTYKRKQESISAQAMPVISQVYEHQREVYENIVVPVSDGTRVFQILANLEKSYKTEGKDLVRSYEKSIILASIDQSWQEHLRELDDLRQSVRNAQYEQKDPLLIYKFEAFELFSAMIDKINRDVVSTLMKAHIPLRDPQSIRQAEAPRRMDLSRLKANKDEMPRYNDPSAGAAGKDGRPRAQQPVRVEKKVGRNDPCPCGSGKKYKNCHGRPEAG